MSVFTYCNFTTLSFSNSRKQLIRNIEHRGLSSTASGLEKMNIRIPWLTAIWKEKFVCVVLTAYLTIYVRLLKIILQGKNTTSTAGTFKTKHSKPVSTGFQVMCGLETRQHEYTGEKQYVETIAVIAAESAIKFSKKLICVWWMLHAIYTFSGFFFCSGKSFYCISVYLYLVYICIFFDQLCITLRQQCTTVSCCFFFLILHQLPNQPTHFCKTWERAMRERE